MLTILKIEQLLHSTGSGFNSFLVLHFAHITTFLVTRDLRDIFCCPCIIFPLGGGQF